jgi:hypothetical protein
MRLFDRFDYSFLPSFIYSRIHASSNVLFKQRRHHSPRPLTTTTHHQLTITTN